MRSGQGSDTRTVTPGELDTTGPNIKKIPKIAMAAFLVMKTWELFWGEYSVHYGYGGGPCHSVAASSCDNCYLLKSHAATRRTCELVAW